SSDEMYGNRIRIERVQDDEIERCGWRFIKFQPGVSLHDLHLRRAIRKVGKQLWIRGDSYHVRVDLIKRPILARLPISRQSARSKSDDGNRVLGPRSLELLENAPD